MPDPVRPAVVITRPLAQARGLADKVAAMGREAIIFPLLEIHPLTDNRALDAALDVLETYALVAFVSPNAIDAAFARRPSWPAQVPLAVMGEGSRQALARHGVTGATHRIFSPQDPDRTDSQTLLAALDLPALAGSQVLILRGESGRELLADALCEAGAVVTQVAAYRRAAPLLDPACANRLRALLQAGCEWVVTSSEALQILVGMVTRLEDAPTAAHAVAPDATTAPSGGTAAATAAATPAATPPSGVARLQQQRLFVPHVRIAETARTLGFSNVVRTASGDERLLAALQFQHD
ncbi:MAG: uroporphyrinogen-III synthase [Herminiimonas sp.]|nr:uroporphyrinogen-III synthase [Herminiimonas sp.]